MARFGQDGYREKQVIETVQGASGVDLRLLSSEERETLAALLTKAQVQTPPAASAAEAVQPAETKSDTQLSRGAVH
jgi:hypothetical protein